jgi:hypothetical protein
LTPHRFALGFGVVIVETFAAHTGGGVGIPVITLVIYGHRRACS